MDINDKVKVIIFCNWYKDNDDNIAIIYECDGVDSIIYGDYRAMYDINFEFVPLHHRTFIDDDPAIHVMHEATLHTIASMIKIDPETNSDVMYAMMGVPPYAQRIYEIAKEKGVIEETAIQVAAYVVYNNMTIFTENEIRQYAVLTSSTLDPQSASDFRRNVIDDDYKVALVRIPNDKDHRIITYDAGTEVIIDGKIIKAEYPFAVYAERVRKIRSWHLPKTNVKIINVDIDDIMQNNRSDTLRETASAWMYGKPLYINTITRDVFPVEDTYCKNVEILTVQHLREGTNYSYVTMSDEMVYSTKSEAAIVCACGGNVWM